MISFRPDEIKQMQRGESPNLEDQSVKQRVSKDHKLNAEELSRLLEIVGRKPTMCEIGVFSAMWSEHCSYKSSRVHLKRLLSEGPQVVVGPGENAGVVHIEDDACIAFKMESHNHPSYIAPYQGAATGVGGILRDVFCMGARPIANLNCLRFGSLDHPRTKYLLEKAVDGIGDYGNCVGVPTVGGEIEFDESFNGNCLVNAMNVGLIDKNKIFKGYASGTGNYLVYAGSATGRDGIHGATMASDSFESGVASSQMTIQVGDPFTEKVLLEATLELLDKELVVGLQDMGAAGLTSSAFEMAARAEKGLYMDLDLVPTRAGGMTAYELMLSESQERMLFVIEPQKWEKVSTILKKWEIAYGIIGEVTDTNRLQATFEGRLEIDLEVLPLTESAPKYHRERAEIEIKTVETDVSQHIKDYGVERLLLDLVRWKTDHRSVVEKYDRHVGARTKYDSTHGGAAVLALKSALTQNKHAGVAISAGCLHRHCKVDPFWGSFLSVLACAREIAATGAKPLAITDCLNFGNPENPEVMEQFSRAIDGINAACGYLQTPVVSGNVSLYNETDGESIHPTPMIGMVGSLKDYRNSRSAQVTEQADLYLIKPIRSGFFGGSLALKVLGLPQNSSPLTPIAIEQEMFVLHWLMKNSLACCRAIGPSGCLATIAKMILPGGFGFRSTDFFDEEPGFQSYFGDMQGGYLLTFEDNQILDFEIEGYELVKIGQVIEGFDQFIFANFRVPTDQLSQKFRSAFES